MLKLPITISNLQFRIPTSLKNYLTFCLLYICSLYHFIFSFLVSYVHPKSIVLFDHDGIQQFRLKIDMLPVYGFETFSIMTCFLVINYWIRKKFHPQMDIKKFLSAYLFSQLAYVGYIHQLVNVITGMNAFEHGILFWFGYTPMFLMSFPLSIFLFNIAIKKMSKEPFEKDNEKTQDNNKALVWNYLVFWGFILIGAAISAGLFKY